MYMYQTVKHQIISFKLNGCTDVCPLEKFEELVKSLLPTEEDIHSCKSKRVVKSVLFDDIENASADKRHLYYKYGESVRFNKYWN